MVKAKKIKKSKPLPPIEAAEIPFELPDGWVWCRLDDLASVVRGGSPRPAGSPKFYGGKIPFLKVADLTNDNKVYVQGFKHTIKEAGLKKTRFIDEETVLLTNSGATLGIPKICNFTTTFNDGIAAFSSLYKELNKKYLYYFLLAKSKWFLIEASRGIGQPNLNTNIIRETLFTLPPLQEQKIIVEKVAALLAKCDALTEEVEGSKEYAEQLMQAVLKEVFEG